VNAYVLDASVAAKWFLPATHETLTEQALRLFEDYAANRIRLVVPDLFWPEIGNLLESLARGAIASNRMFVTADERLANAVAAHFPVRWLGAL